MGYFDTSKAPRPREVKGTTYLSGILIFGFLLYSSFARRETAGFSDPGLVRDPRVESHSISYLVPEGQRITKKIEKKVWAFKEGLRLTNSLNPL